MTAKKPTQKPAPVYHIEGCTFTSADHSELSEAALQSLALALLEQAKAVQAVAAALKGPDAMIRIG